jgi:copper(I)-binding protein
MFHGKAIPLIPAFRRSRRAWLLMLPLAFLGGCVPAEDVRITDARIRAPAPGQDKTAAYFDIRNAGPAELTLTAAESPVARAVEFHRIERDGDMVRMRRQATVVIPAGDTVRFAPGGLHLMVFGVSSPVDGAEFVLTAEDGRQFRARFSEIELGAQE